MLTVAGIIGRIKQMKGLRTDSEVALELGLKPQTLATAKMRGSIPYDALISFCEKEGCSLDLLLRGMELKAEEPLKIDLEAEAESAYVLLPLVEAEAAAGMSGRIPDDSIKDRYPFKRSWVRRLAGGLSKDRLDKLVLVRARGQSMQPTINDGELVLVDLLDRSDIKNDSIYILRAPDGGVLVKRVVLVQGGLLCLSDNKSFKPFEIKLRQGESVSAHVLGRACWVGREL